MAVSDEFTEWFEGTIVDNLWLITLIVIVFSGIILILKVSFPNFKIGESIHIMRNRKTDSNGISTMGSFFVALSSRVGAGNIIGVSLGIIVGGPGSILWLWVFSVFGAVLCFAECTLGQIFKEKRADGLYRGGPAYYALKGIHNERLAMIFSVFMIVMSLILAGVQACNMNNAIRVSVDGDPYIYSLIITAVIAFIICIGIRKITKILTYFVPLFTGAWIVVALITLGMHADRIPDAIASIFSYGLGFESLAGAGIGLLVITGFKRGAFCSEGGTGQISSVSSSADDSHPCIQGYMQAMGVYVDIFFVCTMSALLVLSLGLDKIPFGIDNADMAMTLIVDSLGAGFLGDFSKPFFSLILMSMAFASLTADYLIAESNMKFLFKDSRKPLVIMIVMFLAVIFIMSPNKIGFVWAVGDLIVGILVILNIYMISILYKYVSKTTKDYRKQRREGVVLPTFESEKALAGMDTSGITEWKSS